MAVLDLQLHFRRLPDPVHLIRAISPAFQLQAGDTLNLTVIFSGSYVHSDNLLLVASLVNELRRKGTEVVIEIQGEDTYAGRVNFYELIGLPFEEAYVRKDSSGRFIELRPFDQDSIYPLQDELNMILYQNGGIALEVLQLLFYCLGEIMDNTLVHSGLPSGWMSAQYYPRKEEILLTICDFGNGIHQSLTGQPDDKYKGIKEQDALDLCIQRGVTNGKGLGFGLFATSQFMLKNRGELLLYSGGHYLYASNGQYQVYPGSHWQGTIVSLRIKTNVTVDYKSIMPAHHTLPDDYQFFIDKFFGEDNELW